MLLVTVNLENQGVDRLFQIYILLFKIGDLRLKFIKRVVYKSDIFLNFKSFLSIAKGNVSNEVTRLEISD